MHHPDGTWTLIPLVVKILGLLPGPCIGSRIDSKSVYIINGTLNWNCPSEYSTIGLLCGISILTDSLFLQYPMCSFLDFSSLNPYRQFIQKYCLSFCLLFCLDSNLLRDLIAT